MLGIFKDKARKENSIERRDIDQSDKHTDDEDRWPAKKQTLNINFIRQGQMQETEEVTKNLVSITLKWMPRHRV